MTTESEPSRWLLTVDAATLEAIGRVTVHFAHVEDAVEQLIWSLLAGFDAVSACQDTDGARRSLEAQQIGQAVTARLMFRSKLEMMVALGTERFHEQAERLESISSAKKGLAAAAEKRNRLVHAVWSGNGGGAGAVPPGAAVAIQSRLVEKVGMRHALSVHPQEELGELADSLAELGYAISKLRAALFPLRHEHT